MAGRQAECAGGGEGPLLAWKRLQWLLFSLEKRGMVCRQAPESAATPLLPHLVACPPIPHATSLLLTPPPPQLFTLGGSIEAKAGNTSAAQALFVRAYQLSPDNRQLYMEWPVLEAGLGNEGRARALFRRGLNLHPTNTKIMNLWGSWEAVMGNVEEARALQRRALAVSYGVATMHNRVSLAKLEVECGNEGEARALLKAGLDANPDFLAALTLMAALERRAGNLDLAEAYARRAQRVAGPFDVAVARELQLIYGARGETALSNNLGRHSDNVSALTSAKRAGAWGSEAWAGYYAAAASPKQRAIQRAARRRKVELGHIRTPEGEEREGGTEQQQQQPLSTDGGSSDAGGSYGSYEGAEGAAVASSAS